MRHVLLAAYLFLAATAAWAQTQKPIATDDDTLALGSERIRILGIDTPESHQPTCKEEEAAGDLAAGRLQHLINTRRVTIQREGTDKYGRTLADVTLGRESAAEILIREGLAVPYDGRSKRTFWVRRFCGGQAPSTSREGYLP